MNSSSQDNVNHQITNEEVTGQTTEKDMRADDSNLVEEILTELNQDNPSQVENKSPETPVNNVEHHSMQEDTSVMDMTPDLDIPPHMDVEYDSDENTSNSFMKKIKKPLIVLCLSFLMFNPAVKGLLEKYIPRIFNEGGGILLQQGRVLLLSCLVALLFFATNLLD